ncbi:MAG: hypothetical protein U5K56_13545 [Halioglobus sp.]|nr:hypothetical protein [Halioglobus sp.]
MQEITDPTARIAFPGLSPRAVVRRLASLCAGLFLIAAGPAAAQQAAPATPPEAEKAPAFFFSDDFEREARASLGDPWRDCDTETPDNFEPLGIHDGGVVIADPFTRPGEYDGAPPSGHPPEDDRLFPGIGCAFMETGSTRVSVKIVWSGNFGIGHPPPVSHVEGTPLLYVTPDHPRYGFGAWPTQLYNKLVIFAGYIADPVENFEVLAGAVVDEHTSGTPREIELRAEEPGKVTVWVDGKQLSFNEGYGLAPLIVDPDLIGSTRHGIAVDAHYVDPLSDIPTIKSVEEVVIESLD